MEKKKKKEKVITVGDVEFKVLFGGLLPQISDEEYQRFKASIKEMGVLVPMLTDEDRDIIDRIWTFRAICSTSITISAKICSAVITRLSSMTYLSGK